MSMGKSTKVHLYKENFKTLKKIIEKNNSNNYYYSNNNNK